MLPPEAVLVVESVRPNSIVRPEIVTVGVKLTFAFGWMSNTRALAPDVLC